MAPRPYIVMEMLSKQHGGAPLLNDDIVNANHWRERVGEESTNESGGDRRESPPREVKRMCSFFRLQSKSLLVAAYEVLDLVGTFLSCIAHGSGRIRSCAFGCFDGFGTLGCDAVLDFTGLGCCAVSYS